MKLWVENHKKNLDIKERKVSRICIYKWTLEMKLSKVKEPPVARDRKECYFKL